MRTRSHDDLAVGHKTYTDIAKAKALVQFIWWAETDGQARANELGYAALPSQLRPWIETRLKSISVDGKPVWTTASAVTLLPAAVLTPPHGGMRLRGLFFCSMPGPLQIRDRGRIRFRPDDHAPPPSRHERRTPSPRPERIGRPVEGETGDAVSRYPHGAGGSPAAAARPAGNVCGLCHGSVTVRHGTKKSPPAGAYRRAGGENGSRKEGYRAAVVQTGCRRPKSTSSASLSRAAAGSAGPRSRARWRAPVPSVSAHQMNCTNALALAMSV